MVYTGKNGDASTNEIVKKVKSAKGRMCTQTDRAALRLAPVQLHRIFNSAERVSQGTFSPQKLTRHFTFFVLQLQFSYVGCEWKQVNNGHFVMAFYSLLLRLVHFLIYTRLWLLSWIRWFGTAQFRISKSKFSIDDGRRLVKLPVHLAIQLKENDLSWDDIASMVVWSSAVGITYITLFDSEG